MRLFFVIQSLIFTCLLCSHARADSDGFFTIDSSQYKTDASSVVEVKNMPPVRSQDSIGICYAFEAAAAIDAANCKNSKTDCSKITDKEKASVLDLSRYGVDSSRGADAKSSNGAPPVDGIQEGGNAPLVIYNAAFEEGSFVRESCAPFDKIVAKPGTEKEALELQEAAWESLKVTYEQYKKKFADCKQCALDFASTATDKIKQDFNLQQNNNDILKAFAADTYSEFLNNLLIPENCKTSAREMIDLGGAWSIETFPRKKSDQNYNAFVGKIKNVLKMQNPVMVNGYCAADQKPAKKSQCRDRMHGFLITGYRKVCDSKNKCKEAVKVHNSWGQSWQDQNDGGWVDAKSVFDRTYYESSTLAWLQEK